MSVSLKRNQYSCRISFFPHELRKRTHCFQLLIRTDDLRTPARHCWLHNFWCIYAVNKQMKRTSKAQHWVIKNVSTLWVRKCPYGLKNFKFYSCRLLWEWLSVAKLTSQREKWKLQTIWNLKSNKEHLFFRISNYFSLHENMKFNEEKF